jgi:uncharacterized protein (DUF1800 family)
MKCRSFTLFFLFFSSCYLYSQPYTDYIGAGHSDGITVTASSSQGGATPDKTINGSGMDARLFEASRFLAQASFGANKTEIETLAEELDFNAWIDEQAALPVTSFKDKLDEIWAEIVQMHLAAGETEDDLFGPWGVTFNYAWMQNTVDGPDQLRMKVAYALSQILVISNNSDIRDWGQGISAYYDILMDGSFGNYKDLLTDVSLSPLMGYYLSHLNNPKAIPEENIQPDENYAREIMQLFSIGLYELNIDGTRKKDDDGNDIPTYDNDDIDEVAKVFTGLGPGDIEDYVDWTNEPYFGLGIWGAHKITPMVMYQDFHETEEKIILKDHVIPANQAGMDDIDDLIDILFNHENVGPFLAYRLIQRLVKSNPSPAYVARVAEVFNDDGNGERGNMLEVVRAILLDEEARSCEALLDDVNGRLREPITKHTQLVKSIPHDSPFGRYWNAGYSFMETNKQLPMWAPTVFNFYLPDHLPLGDLAANDMVAPEFKLHDTQTATGYINTVNGWTIWNNLMHSWEGDYGDENIVLNTTELEAMASEPEVLMNELDIIFTHGQMSDETRGYIRDAVAGYPIEWDNAAYYRARLAIYLVLISADYNIIK